MATATLTPAQLQAQQDDAAKRKRDALLAALLLLWPRRTDAPDIAAAIDTLAGELTRANSVTYLRILRAHAHDAGLSMPKSISPDAQAGIRARATVSATSIIQTRITRMAALVKEYGSLDAARGPYATWVKAQQQRVLSYEAGMTAHAAMRDFQAATPALTGTEHVEPRTGICAACNAAIDMGTVPIGTLPDMPIHLNCVHEVVVTYSTP